MTNASRNAVTSASCHNLYFCNPGQNIWNRIEKHSKARQVKKSLISTSACFWTVIALSLISEGRPGAALCLHPNFRFF